MSRICLHYWWCFHSAAERGFHLFVIKRNLHYHYYANLAISFLFFSSLFGVWLCSQWHRVPVHSYQCPSLFYILSSHHHISAGLGLAQCHGQCHHLHLTLVVLLLVKKKGFHQTFSFSLRSKSSSRLREMKMSLCQRCMMVNKLKSLKVAKWRKVEWRMMMDEGWRMMISSCWGVLLTDGHLRL